VPYKAEKAGLIHAKIGKVSLSSLELGDTKVYEPSIRALLGTASHFPYKAEKAGPIHAKIGKVFFFFITLKPRVE